ncbi:MAG: 4Fe-4S dicluster domain-containing protein [Anaerolineae bacterium]|nr:4Fe-4S dicluster domain-containing protein [Anaerolineae bacterium]
MEPFLFAKDQLSEFVAELMSRVRLYAPVPRDQELRFDEVKTPDEVVLDYRNTTKPPKMVLFPQTERMIAFAQEREHFNKVLQVPFDEQPKAILGLRPCDARSFLLFDKVFGAGKYIDPYYQARRKSTLILALACTHPRPTCFCHAFGSGPYDSEGADILMRDAGDAYLLEAVSEKGAALLEELGLAQADQAHLQKAAELEEAAYQKLVEIEPVEGIERDLEDLFESELWAEISEKCLACGTCTYNCPTCHCFTIEDRVLSGGGERVRSWDSCMYPYFTLHASGHNPRPDQASRWRQRVMHKFEYLPHNVGLYGCVGCGRCVVNCPVLLDIRQVLRRVRQERASKVES